MSSPSTRLHSSSPDLIRRLRSRTSVAVAALAVGVLALSACAGAATTSTTSGVRELVIARAMDLSTLDPDRGYCDTCQILYSAMYDTLVTVGIDDPTAVVPRLATSWTASDDMTRYTFTLDPDAVFSDGSPVEAADVAFSLMRLKNIAGSASFLMGGLASVDTPDAQTVVVNLDAPNSAFLAILAASYTGIVNQEVVEAAGGSAGTDAATADAAEDWFLTASAGSGPYMLGEYVQGDHITLTANPEYWGTAPTFPSVTIKEVTDSSSQLQQLQQGDIDIAMQISPDALDQLDGTSVSTQVVDSYNFVYLLLQPGAVGGEALGDVRVRQAIADAIDYQGIIDATVGGYGQEQGSPIPNGFEGSADQTLPTRDVEAAKALLADAGYAGGLTLAAPYPTFNVYGVDFDVMMQSVQQDLAEAGITLELQPLEYSQWADLSASDGLPVSAVYFAPDHMDTSQYVSYFGMVPTSPWSAMAGTDGAVVNQQEVDLFATALTQTGEERAATYTALGELMAQDLVAIPLVNPQLVLASASDISGLAYSPCCNLDLAALGLNG